MTLAVVFSICWAPAVLAQDMTGNINVFLGAKALDEDDWEPVEDQSEFGIKLDLRSKDWPVNIAIDYLASKSDEESVLLFDPDLGTVELELEGETSELNLGVRKIWDHFPYVRPFIGGGLSFITAEAKGSALGVTISDDDSGVGIWIDGGVYWTLADHFNIGLEAAFSSAEVTLFDVDVEAGGGHFGILAGYHW